MLIGACNEAVARRDRIERERGWQLSTQTWQTVKARFVAYCSGDSVRRVSGAEHRWGRESRREFG